MVLTLSDRQLLARVLTGSQEGRDYMAKSGPKFPYRLETAKARLVDASLGLEHPASRVPAFLVDKKEGTIKMEKGGAALSIDKLPAIASQMVNEVDKDVYALTPLAYKALRELPKAKSKDPLRSAFFNEVLLQSNMENYLKKLGGEVYMNAHRDKLRHMVDAKGFEASFNDGLKDLKSQMGKSKGKGMTK